MPKVNVINAPAVKSAGTGYKDTNSNPNPSINTDTSLTRTSRNTAQLKEQENLQASLTRTSRNTAQLKEQENLQAIRTSLELRMRKMFGHLWNISKPSKAKPIMPKKEYYALRLDLREIEGKAISSLMALSDQCESVESVNSDWEFKINERVRVINEEAESQNKPQFKIKGYNPYNDRYKKRVDAIQSKYEEFRRKMPPENFFRDISEFSQKDIDAIYAYTDVIKKEILPKCVELQKEIDYIYTEYQIKNNEYSAKIREKEKALNINYSECLKNGRYKLFEDYK
jgi:hypothetical protein